VFPKRLELKREKFEMQTSFMETERMEDFYYQCMNIMDSNFLMQKITELACLKGFRPYRHSDSMSRREQKVLILCGQYQYTRCPFLLVYKRIGSANEPFALVKYRPEHNHSVYSFGLPK